MGIKTAFHQQTPLLLSHLCQRRKERKRRGGKRERKITIVEVCPMRKKSRRTSARII